MLPDLLAILRSPSPGRAIEALSAWAPQAGYPAAAALVHDCPEADRARLTSVLRDILSLYPTTLYGTPILMNLRSDRPYYDLPACDPMPIPEAIECRWQALGHSSPWHPDRQHAPGIICNRPNVMLLLARMPEHAPPPEVPDSWLGWRFSTLPEDEMMHISARMVLPYPDALEAARVMRDIVATGESAATTTAFLSPSAHTWACEAARAFRDFADA